ncbi:beta-L-arabinofuranosidase domain-containing protein [Rhodanobacter sp. DHG33]|uniref:beta-L-arabinofuranosidase domain-containing protein n=1 Tax=Rhodanobacter sp. DHG33 TaxID=2775921 RepID=UPI00177E8F37|nr:beta-L-arabinofuranosidase domain-containing protein [Rhodanobacter sp. DHG33]MBD8899009.1 glycoside hydrolase family 127 protein [Rhodanobacter sp. DHG33]
MTQRDPLQGRRDFLRASGALGLAAMLPGAVRAASSTPGLAPQANAGVAAGAPLPSRAPLAQQPFRRLPAGAIKPAGWLRRQLEIQASGLGGHLDETWADVGPNSGWLGGTGESWERGPYFLDGLLPLAWQLDSPVLKAKAQKFIDWTLEHPWPNGMFGPRSNDDWWPRMVMLKVLTQYHELTGDARVIPLMTNYFAYQLGALPQRPLRDWGRSRWQDELLSVLWLYDRTGDARLLQLANLLHQQGFDWQGMFADFRFKEKVDVAALEAKGGDAVFMKDLGQRVHGVNIGMSIKSSPVWSLVSGSAQDREAVHHQLAMLDTYHGMPNGMFSADEHLAGRNPSQGTELCTVVETMFSLEVALAITGDAALADRLETIAYNALPGTFTDDMWAHQYDQESNQVECSLHRRPWTSNGPEANLFGLEPHFGCCTANFHQGWPKLTASLWMATADGGIAAMVYAPCTVQTAVQSVPLRIEQNTDYPFRSRVEITLHPAQATAFALKLRIPGWATASTLTVNGHAQATEQAGRFVTLHRAWQPGDTIALTFASKPTTVPGFNDSVSVRDGALVFALPIAESWIKWRQRGLTADWQVYPASRWNMGLPENASFHRTEQPVGAIPFSRHQPPVTLSVQGRAVASWKAEEGAADPVPRRPQADAADTPEMLTLLPYAAPKLRITAFPLLAPGSDEHPKDDHVS